jgi:hypothetical protein
MNMQVVTGGNTVKTHKRRKTCVKCGAVWEMEFRDDEAWVEWLTCPRHRVKKGKND